MIQYDAIYAFAFFALGWACATILCGLITARALTRYKLIRKDREDAGK